MTEKMTDKWFEKSGAEGDVAISTRVRLARNIAGYPFPEMLNKENQKKILTHCRDAIKSLDIDKNFDFLNFTNITPLRARSLTEKHLISPEFEKIKREKGLILSKDESISIMLNEEDHLRIQSMSSGFSPENAFSVADKIDTSLESYLSYAFDERLGYLTRCPTNLGTAMRVSVMLHLPALTITGAITKVIASLGNAGLTVRGFYGEGSSAVGDIYQVSNQVTLGLSEQEAIERLKRGVLWIIEQERELREGVYKANPNAMEDKVWRAYGILSYARSINSKETLALLSQLRMGMSLKIINGINYDVLNKLYMLIPSSVISTTYNVTSAENRDVKRATVIRDILKNNKLMN